MARKLLLRLSNSEVSAKLAHLRPFGCICYAFIPPGKRTKLDSTTERCRLLGYEGETGENVKGYRLLRRSDLSIFFALDVRFNEAQYPPPALLGVAEVEHADYVLNLTEHPAALPSKRGR